MAVCGTMQCCDRSHYGLRKRRRLSREWRWAVQNSFLTSRVSGGKFPATLRGETGVSIMARSAVLLVRSLIGYSSRFPADNCSSVHGRPVRLITTTLRPLRAQIYCGSDFLFWVCRWRWLVATRQPVLAVTRRQLSSMSQIPGVQF